jgi:YesN/AraC family two-component response regulator
MLLTEITFRKLEAEYCGRWKCLSLCAALPDGSVVFAGKNPLASETRLADARRHVIAEGLRWGEPTLYEHTSGVLLWAAPLTYNSLLTGGLVACGEDADLFTDNGGILLDLCDAFTDLRLLAERENLVNREHLAAQRAKHHREQKRAEAIHETKCGYYNNILSTYMKLEPDLVSAIRQEDRPAAIGIINRILAEVYHYGGGSLDLVKSFIMELVVTMCRTAVESGNAPGELLGTNYASLTELGAINGEEELAHWLVQMMNHILDSMQKSKTHPSAALLQYGIDFMQRNYTKNISRDDAALAAKMSPSHFSRLLKERTGRGFTDLLNQIRVDRAAELLRDADLTLMEIALETGFTDQSYFTKVFRRHTSLTPREFRQRGG